MIALNTRTIGAAWIKSCQFIFEKGMPMKDEDKNIRELLHFFLTIKNPHVRSKIVSRYGDPAMIEWMVSNFMEQKKIPELKNGLSYGVRLFNYNGKNQIEWVIQKLKQKPEAKSVTIPLIIPTEDEGYIPCVSMLDFKIRDGILMLVAFCRSIDFGKKVYANMLALNKVQQMVCEKIKIPCGDLVMYVVSAHIYEDDYNKMKQIITDAESDMELKTELENGQND